MWYRKANLIKISEEAYGKSERDLVFALLAKSLKMKKANGDERRLKEIMYFEAPEKNLSLIEKTKIKMHVGGIFNKVFANSFELNAENETLIDIDELAEQYSMIESYKNDLKHTLFRWVNEHP
jgi:hypothetical protein